MIVHDFQESAYASQLGICQTVKNIVGHLTWGNIWAETETYMQPGTQGQSSEASRAHAADEAMPLCDGLPMILHDHNASAVVVDALTKYVIAVPSSKDSPGAGLTLVQGLCTCSLWAAIAHPV